MDVTQTQPATGASPSAPAASTSIISSDFEVFLQMLTAQARYQDPLEPIDSSEYAAQLAQFSMVEQQVQSNELLTALSDQLGAGTIGEMAAWIGMEARTTAPVAFRGTPLTVAPAVDPGADEAVLVAYNESGDEVTRQQISLDGAALEWAGVATDGSPLPDGNYRFVTESRALGETIASLPSETYARITEARRNGADTLLILDGGASVSSGSVNALREPVL